MTKFKNIVSKTFHISFILLTIIFFLNKNAFSQGAASVETDVVVLEALNQTIPVIGRIVSLKEADVPAAVIGKIEKVLVDVGDKVKEGQILALIDIERYKWFAEIASANVAATKAEIKSAKAETNINLIELNRTNLIGVFGKRTGRIALIRLSSGNTVKVKAGQQFGNGWTVISIDLDKIHVTNGIRQETLRIPG